MEGMLLLCWLISGPQASKIRTLRRNKRSLQNGGFYSALSIALILSDSICSGKVILATQCTGGPTRLTQRRQSNGGDIDNDILEF